MNDGVKRFEIFFERHIGFGVRWENFLYPLHLSIAVPFITINIGFGRQRFLEGDELE
jgi:hypothetical protein